MELRHCRYFIAVAEELSFTKAAGRLGISQPPLSQQIRSLEEEIGVPLFVRTKRSVRLTEAGRHFLEKAYRILGETDRAVQAARRAARGEIGDLTVGFVASAAFDFLPRVVAQFMARYPDAKLELRDLTTVEQLRDLAEGRIELGLMRPPVDDPELRQEPVIREEFVAVLPSNHRLGSRASIDLRSLAEESFIMVPGRVAPGLRSQMERICRFAGFEPRVRLEVGQLDLAVSFAAAGFGVALLPASIALFRHAGVLFRPLAGLAERAEIVAVWKPGEESPTLVNFMEMARSAAKL